MIYANKIGEIAEFLEKAELSLLVGDVIHAGLTSRALNKGDTRLLIAVKIPPNGTTGILCRENGRRIIGRRITSACNAKKKRPRGWLGRKELREGLLLFSQKYALAI